MLTYRELQERKLGVMRHNDKVQRAQDDAESHGFEMEKPQKHKNDASHTRFRVRQKPTKKNPEGGPWIDRVKKGDEEISVGTDKKDGTMGKVGRDSLKAAMKQDWNRRGTPNPEKRAEMKAGIGNKKRTHSGLSAPAGRPDKETRRAMKDKTQKRGVQSEHTEWWLGAFRLDERAGGPASPTGRERAEKQAAQNQQNMQAKRRDPGASNPRGSFSGPTQSMRDSAARERNASRITRPARSTRPTVTAKGTGLGGQKQTMSSTSRPANTVKAPSGFKKGTNSLRTSQTSNGPTPTPVATPSRTPASRPTTSAEKSRLQAAARRNAAADKRSRERDADSAISKRKSGVGAGIASAFGGDVIGMGRKAGDTPEMDEKRKEMNRKAKGDFAKKKVQQTGNLAKSAVGKTYSALTSKGKSGEDVETGSESGNVSGGSEFTSRTKRG